MLFYTLAIYFLFPSSSRVSLNPDVTSSRKPFHKTQPELGTSSWAPKAPHTDLSVASEQRNWKYRGRTELSTTGCGAVVPGTVIVSISKDSMRICHTQKQLKCVPGSGNFHYSLSTTPTPLSSFSISPEFG